MLKKSLIVVGVLVLSALSQIHAQDKFELTPFVGYRFGGDFDVSDPRAVYRSFEIDDSAAYGLMLDINVGENGQVELLWNRQDTELDGQLASNGRLSKVTDLTVDYWHVGGNFLFGDEYDDARGFLNFMAGATHFSPTGFDSETQFSFSFGGGAKFYLSDLIGIRVQARFISTYLNSTSEWFCNPFCYTVSVGNYVVQAEVDAGLIFRF